MPALGSRVRVPATERLNAPAFDPAQATGQPLLLYWWASTCPFCALQSPAMEAFWREHKGRGLHMLAISIDRRREDAEAYLQKKGYTFPSTWATAAFKQALPKPKGLPITWMIGPDGRLMLAERGQMFAEDVQAMASLW
jgi:peroxiredoxin